MNVLAGSKPMAMMSLALLLQYPWTSSIVRFSENRYLGMLASLFLNLPECPTYFSSSVIMMMSYQHVSIAKLAPGVLPSRRTGTSNVS